MNPRLIALGFALTTASGLINPVIPDQDVPDPGAILVDGFYYVVTTGGDFAGNKFPIHVSSDL